MMQCNVTIIFSRILTTLRSPYGMGRPVPLSSVLLIIIFYTLAYLLFFFTPKVNKLPRDIEKKYEKCIKWSGNYSGCLSTKKNWCSKQRSVKTLHDNWNPLIRKLNFSDVAWKLWQTSPQTWHFLCILQYNWHCLGYVKHVMRMMMMLMLMSVCRPNVVVPFTW